MSVTDQRLGMLRAGDEIAGVYACTRKDRLTARTGTPYLALELRDRTAALPARVFRDADLLGGRFDRGDLVAGAQRAQLGGGHPGPMMVGSTDGSATVSG